MKDLFIYVYMLQVSFIFDTCVRWWNGTRIFFIHIVHFKFFSHIFYI